ncbi:MAG: ABC transporter permease [Acholeplasmatales bacterium]|nr:MAG: ABC transporter permease [Acholeplasmatales bacterium]
MRALLYTFYLKTKLDLRNAEILISYYAVPLVFFAIMGSVFTTIMPDAFETIFQTMTIFTVTMGAFIGTPATMTQYVGDMMRKTLKSAGIPLYALVLSTFVSGVINLIVVTLIIALGSTVFFNATGPQNIGVFLAGYPLFLGATLSMGILLGLYARNSARLAMYSQALFLPSLLLSGIMFPAEMLPSVLRTVGFLFPARHAMQLFTAHEHALLPYLFLGGFMILATVMILLKIKSLRLDDRV